MSASLTAVPVVSRSRTGLVLIALLAVLTGGFTALWPAQVTSGMPQTPSLGVHQPEPGSRWDMSNAIPSPLILTPKRQHCPACAPMGQDHSQVVAMPPSEAHHQDDVVAFALPMAELPFNRLVVHPQNSRAPPLSPPSP